MGDRGRKGPVGAEVAEFLASGVAIMVASRDAELRPEIARGWGPGVSVAGDAVEVCLVVPPRSGFRANLEENGAIALNCTLPSSYRAVQLKGRAIEVREPTEEDLGRARLHATRFVEETARVGAPAPSGYYVQAIDLAVSVAVEEVFDQTPGPAAGSRL